MLPTTSPTIDEVLHSIVIVFCGKKCKNCYEKVQQKGEKEMEDSTKRKRVMWHNDSPNQNISSLFILIDWWITGTNYDWYHRDSSVNNSNSKESIASEISRRITEAGITSERKPADIWY